MNKKKLLRLVFQRASSKSPKIKIPEKVIGANRDSSGQLLFLIKWKGIEKYEIISAEKAYTKCPQFILRWYEERVKWDVRN